MNACKIGLLLLLSLSFAVSAQINFDTMTPGTWASIPTSGNYPGFGVETHLAFDTSGNAYMLGSCSYYGSAGGTHNNDIFRFNIRTGVTALPFTCGTDPWPGGCQGGQVFDATRNCIWFGPGNNSVCRTGVEFFPGLNYYGGLYKMQCPAGRPVMVRSSGLSGGYYLFDPANDLVIGVKDNNYFGCLLSIYDIQHDSVYTTASPWNPETYTWRIPCCFDTKRGRVVITRWGNTSSFLSDIWYYTTATKQWTKQTPSGTIPPQTNMPLVYEPVADKYVLIGSNSTPFVWSYDPNTNTWTDRSGGSGPASRVYPGCMGYSPKDGVIANWGGLNTGDNGNAENNKQPIWVYKMPGRGTATEKRDAKITLMLCASPNPFNSSVTLTLPTGLTKGAKIRIHDAMGRLVSDLTGTERDGIVSWSGAGFTPGLYLVTAEKAGLKLQKKIVLAK